MVPKVHKSKRVSAHKRYKIERKVREHNRKARKERRLHPKKLKKDPGIPSLWPFKDKLLKEVEERKQQSEEEKRLRKEQVKAQRQDLAALKRSAEQRAKEFERSERDVASDTSATNRIRGDNSRKTYYKEFKKVIEAADVILEVLDARDPLGCRSKQIEELILSSGSTKKIILVLNKIDLVPREVAEKWLKYLRNEFPTIAFKASTQTQRKHLAQSSMPIDAASDEMLNSSECLGADTLIKLLKNYCRNINIKTSISVGVIGFPNVGKSSLINSLKRSKACGVGAMPGFTKTVQEIHLDKHIKLLDCPGIIFATGTSEADVLLRNCIKVEDIEDPVTAVGHLLTRIESQHLMQLYSVPAFGNPQDFLAHLARARGKLKKGGVPDLDMAGRVVLQDWNVGKIPYYTEPPKEMRLLDASIVANYSKEFSLSDLAQAESADLATLQSQNDAGAKFVAMRPSEQLQVDLDGMDQNEGYDIDMDDDDIDDDDDDADDVDDDEEEEGMEYDDGDDSMDELPDDYNDDEEGDDDSDEPEAMQTAVTNNKGKGKGKGKVTATSAPKGAKQATLLRSDVEASLNPQSNRDLKKMMKQDKRAARRGDRFVSNGGHSNGDAVDEAYSFDRDFV